MIVTPVQDDRRMGKIMQLAHEFLQKFCYKNETNQNLLHRHLDLFLLSGDNVCTRDAILLHIVLRLYHCTDMKDSCIRVVIIADNQIIVHFD